MMILNWCFVYLALFVIESYSQENNVCKSYNDYFTIRNNPNCWYDIAAAGNATDTIKAYGYPLETYQVTTSDGYILSLYRIPNHNATIKRNPVFLQHGLMSTASNFLGKRKDSLAFLLSDLGYDVWLGNYRGTQFAEGHVNLTVKDEKYWDHGYDQIALIDLPAMLNVIRNQTGRNGDVIALGHSLGTTALLAYASWFPEEAKQTFKLIILVAPAANLPHIISPYGLLAPFAEAILKIVRDNHLTRIVSQAETLMTITKLICLESPVLMQRCLEAVNLFYGPLNQMPPDTVPVFFNQFPAGSSIKVTRQAADLVLDFFGRYNYGLENIKRYGSLKPPAYNVTAIDVPVFIMYAISDWACTKADSQALFKRLSPTAKAYGLYEVNVKNFNHVDFLFGENVKTIAYARILELIQRVG